MGGFSNVLGSVAQGFNQAHEQDMQRSFADEQNRRGLAANIFQGLAFDPNQHPDIRNSALQGLLNVINTPTNKKYDFSKASQPLYDTMAQVRAQQAAGRQVQPPQTSVTPGQQIPGATSTLPAITKPMAPGTAGPPQMTMPPTSVQAQGGQTLPQVAQFTPPPTPPPSLLAGVPELARNAGQMAGAQAGGQLQGQIAVRSQAINEMMAAHPELANDPMMQQMLPMMTLGGTMPYGMFQMGMAGPETTMTAGQARANPQLAPLVPQSVGDNDTVQLTRNRANVPISIQPIVVPSTLSKTTSASTTTPGGLTTTHKQTITPQLPGGGVSGTNGTISTPPAPKRTNGAQGGGKALPAPPPAVAAAMDNLMMYGMPEGKMNDAQALAEQHMKALGIDPQIAASVATKSMADKGRAILPLIARARQLIAANPDALGPLAGRWSELQNRTGNLEGPAKELAGTLVSIYSMAGGMHGWRAATVPEQFAKTYGDLSNDPASLNTGLDSLANTANALTKIAYPGAPAGNTPPAPKSTFRWADHQVIK